MDPFHKSIYLTFDDGPHPSITPLVLAELEKFNAQATFFCIGKNVIANPLTYNNIINQGHIAGNHSQNHLDGFITSRENYIDDIIEAKKNISSNLFRPPYGRLKHSQAKKLNMPGLDLKVVMWSVLSGDFDKNITKERCLSNVLNNSGAGSIIVFHDSEKAAEKMLYVLPKTLEFFVEKGYSFRPIKIECA